MGKHSFLKTGLSVAGKYSVLKAGLGKCLLVDEMPVLKMEFSTSRCGPENRTKFLVPEKQFVLR